MLAERLRDHDDTLVDDKIVVVRGLSWSDYQRLLEVRGEASVPRYAYLEGQLEIMTPSLPHESDTEGYSEVPGSRVLPGIDLEQLVSFLDRPSASQAMREYRAALAK